MKYEWSSKVVWITGASSGIGAALAQSLASKGCQLILSGRSVEKLSALAGSFSCQVKALLLPFDVTEKDAHLTAVQTIKDHFGRVDTMILNAGDCLYVESTVETEPFERMISTNFLSQVYGVSAVLPLLKESSQPHLVMVCSSVVYLPLPRAEAYGASKAALHYFGESLRVHLSYTPIAITMVYPGFVKTPLTDKNDFQMPGRVSAQTAAELIIRGVQKKKRTIAFPRVFIAVMKLLALLPEPLKYYLLKKTVKKS